MSQDVDRMSVTLPPDLLSELNDVVDAGEYNSRSEATRDALRAFVTEFKQQTGLSETLSGTVVVLYQHEHSGVTNEMSELQHDFTDTIVAVHHVHLSDHLCLESIAVDGSGARIEALLSRIRPLEGVHQVKLAMVQAERNTDTHTDAHASE
ncbi:CopG family ribbon-helix-helix protein [Haloquadratum walsbyi]|jgi:Predicted transcriptional regulators containing the CopG/Arc/MetJ DNA-binding domain and a metal-binding domain|uniref:Putative nickel-responsive regulator n=1 Tax=Haloquadratum walsbyi J07HQW2 TaxID=1238425 RepID=U1MZ44_9EURY|nr:CopG family ribbon-helix-helix protein [Haloquadratum walsbyi]ERG95789.1 MAG: transcriptional regulator, CopG family protein [Haloquadratum walsbyi J07HQW2]